MTEYAIWIVKETLTDGSEVFAVELPGEKFDCISANDAMEMAEKVQAAIVQHTNGVAAIFEA